MVKIVTQADFKAEVLDSKVPVLLDFYADWCPPCRALAPELEALDKIAGGKLKILKVNVDDIGGAPAKLMQERNIRGIPALLLLDAGKVVAQRAGYQSRTQLQEWVGKSLGLQLAAPPPPAAPKPGPV
jgi:thioredoxin 1